jgi:hypothetical protein
MRHPSAPIRIVAVAAVLALALVGLVVHEGRARAEGREVRLAMAGYDPRSLLSGHYVQFALRHDLPAGTPCPGHSEGPPRPEDRWVALRPDGVRHVPVAETTTRQAALRLAPVAVRGDLACSRGVVSEFGRAAGQPAGETSLMVDLGINRIHLEQTQAEAMERQLRRFGADQPVEADAIVSVGRDGKARLVGVVVGGKRTDLDWF